MPSDSIARRRSIIRRQPAEHERGFSLTEKKTAEASASAHTPQPPVAVSIVAGAWSGRDCAHGTAHHCADRPSHNGPRSHSGCRAHGLALGGTGGALL